MDRLESCTGVENVAHIYDSCPIHGDDNSGCVASNGRDDEIHLDLGGACSTCRDTSVYLNQKLGDYYLIHRVWRMKSHNRMRKAGVDDLCRDEEDLPSLRAILHTLHNHWDYRRQRGHAQRYAVCSGGHLVLDSP